MNTARGQAVTFTASSAQVASARRVVQVTRTGASSSQAARRVIVVKVLRGSSPNTASILLVPIRIVLGVSPGPLSASGVDRSIHTTGRRLDLQVSGGRSGTLTTTGS
jgi:hypothetical protein